MSQSFKLTGSHDLEILPDVGCTLVSGPEYVVQKLKVVMLSIEGDWFLNLESGMPYFDEFTEKNISEARVYEIVKLELLNVEEVEEILLLEVNIRSDRTLYVKFRVSTIYGNVSGEL